MIDSDYDRSVGTDIGMCIDADYDRSVGRYIGMVLEYI